MNEPQQITFPEFSGIRCLMMPYIQGDPESVPKTYEPYRGIIESVFLKRGDLGFLTIDESPVVAGMPHRGARARFARALHTEAGRDPNKIYCWGGGGWGRPKDGSSPSCGHVHIDDNECGFPSGPGGRVPCQCERKVTA